MDDFFEKTEPEEEALKTPGTFPSQSSRRLQEEEKIRGARFLRECLSAEDAEPGEDSAEADDSAAIVPTLDLRMAEYPVLSAEEERELLYKLRSADSKEAKRARDTLVLSNSRMVISVVKRVANYTSCEFADLYQGGVIGLMMALRNFDPGKGVRLMTYARDWILQYASRTAASCSAVHLPDSQLPLMRMIRSVRQRYMAEYHTEPSVSRIADELDLTAREVQAVMRAADNLVYSIDTPAGDEDIDFLDVFNADPDAPNDGPTAQTVIDKVAHEELRSMLPQVMRQVLCPKHERELLVLLMRYGLEQYEPSTLDEIGKIMGLSRERVRQLEAQGKKRLRQDARFCKLMIYLESD